MLSKELEKLVSNLGGLVIVENDQPKFVLVSYDKFNSLIHKSIDNSGNFDKNNKETPNVSGYHAQSDEEIIDRLNEEILVLKEQVAEKEKELTGNL